MPPFSVLDLPSPPEHWLKLKPEVLEPPDSPSESKFDNLENCSSSNKDLDFEAKKDVKIKLEPLNTDSAYDDVSDDNSPLPADCRVAPDNLVVTKEEKSRNYDEWAEIQKELEMYPLESDETSEGNLGYEPSDDNTALADFEPPVPKVAKNVDSSLEAHTSLLHSDGMTSHVHSRPSVSHHLNLKSDPLGIGDDNAWNAALDVQMENNIDTVSACIQTTGDSEEQMTNLMIRHGRASEEDANDGDLGLADIDGLDGQYDHMDEGTLSRSMPRTSHVSECDDECGPCDVTSLFDTTFKSTSSGVDLSDMRNGSFDRSQDDDLNAQVQSAINSILNLQRIDDSCDAFVMSGVSHDELKGLQVCVSGSSCVEGGEGVDPGREKSPHFAFDMMKQEEEEDEECVSTSRVEEDEDLDEDDGEDDEGEEDDAVGCMEYEASSVAAEMGSFGNDGPSEIDVALDEAVKSILL